MWIGICEDETSYRNRLEREVRSVAHKSDRITSYANGSDLLDAVSSMAYPMDLLLLDMEMPALSGIETARELQSISPGTQSVIITKHQTYALESYQIRPSNYLIKPVSVKLLQNEIERARRIIGEENGETLRIVTKDKVSFVPLKDILYIECFNYTLHIHAVNNMYKFNYRLGQLSEELAGKGFCRTHRSLLVNLRHVESIDRRNKTAMLVNRQVVTVGETRITEVLAEYSRYRQSLLPTNVIPICTAMDDEDYSISLSLAGTLG